ncbi:MAG: hypothetical protein QOF76_2822 [Solirubrobacteraceae bacterium]|jgi:hypothetical protein|nr:hypothetical protein [Solirubrobacteraceae bacterium]
MYSRSSPIGLIAVDLLGDAVGRIEATFPYDGSDPEFAVVRLFDAGLSSHLVPVRGCIRYDDTLQFPFTFYEIRDSPSLQDYRWEYEQGDKARSYW